MFVVGFYFMFFYIFFFKQKTAYELRISDWSSDVCSSDLAALVDVDALELAELDAVLLVLLGDVLVTRLGHRRALGGPEVDRRGRAVQIGRASCRERVCQYV